MCLLILNTEGVISEAEFLTSWRANPHGGGLAWVSGNKIKAWRTLKGPRIMYKKYVKEREENNGLFIIHFRLATHGAKTLENTHPFKINPRLYFAHNGIMNEYGSSGVHGGSVSDTRDFGNKILSKLPENFIEDDNICAMLEKHIGTYNKIVLINAENKYRILNEKMGHWDHRKTNWYSNYGYRSYSPPTKSTYTPPAKSLTEVKALPPSTVAAPYLFKPKSLLPVVFETNSVYNKKTQSFMSYIKSPAMFRKTVGPVDDKEITFAEVDCGLSAFIDEYDRLVWVWSDDNNDGIEYSRKEIQSWMDANNKSKSFI